MSREGSQEDATVRTVSSQPTPATIVRPGLVGYSPINLSTSSHLWKRAHQIALFQAELRFKRSEGSCAISARTVSTRQPPNIGRSGPLRVPAETARDSGVTPFSPSTV